MAGTYRQRYIDLVNSCTDPTALQQIIDAKQTATTAECTMIRWRLSQFAQGQPLPSTLPSFKANFDLYTKVTWHTGYGSQTELDDGDVRDLQNLAIAKQASLLNARTIKARIAGLSANAPVLNGNNVLTELGTYNTAVGNNGGNGVPQVTARRAAFQALNMNLGLGLPDVTNANNLSNAEYAVIEADALAKRTSLTNAVNIKAGIAGLSPNTPVLNVNQNVVAALNTYHNVVTNTHAGNTPQEVTARRAALQTLNTTLNLGLPDASQPNNLTDADYAAIQTDVLAKRSSLTNAAAIKAGIAVLLNVNTPVLNGHNVAAELYTYQTVVGQNPGNTPPEMTAKRAAFQALNSHLGLGFPDVTIVANLSDAEYAVIQTDTLAKRTSLANANTIKTGIAAFSVDTPVLNTHNVLAELNTYHTVTTTNPGQTPPEMTAKRAAFQVLNTNLGLRFADVTDANNLSNAEYNLIEADTLRKRTSLSNAETITNEIDGFAFTDNESDNKKILKILKNITTATTDEDIRTALHNARGVLRVNLTGGLDNESLLSSNDARALKTRAEQKYNFLLITNAIKSISEPQKLERLVAARNHTEICNILNGNRDFGNLTIIPATLLRNDALEIQRQAGLQHAGMLTQTNFANTFMQVDSGRLQYFKDDLVRKEDPRPDVPLSTNVPGLLLLFHKITKRLIIKG